MRRAVTVIAGALTGAAVGVLLLVLTHPTSAYLNDAYRSGASMGFVLRYVVLGIVAALLIGALRRGAVPAAVGLAVVLALAILPPALDGQSASEKRLSAVAAEEDPLKRASAEVRAGAVDGCVDSTKRELEGTDEAETIDADAYCTCFIAAVTAGPRDDEAQLQAMARDAKSGNPSARLERMATRCAARALQE